VTGMSQSDAERAIRDAGLVVGGITEKYDPKVPMGNVISQEPVAGRKMNSGSKITLVISLGSGSTPMYKVIVPVPDLLGKSFEEAKTILEEKGLKCVMEEEYSDVVASGSVVKTQPAVDSTVDKGSTVIVVISKGPEKQPVTSPETTTETETTDNN